MSSRGLYRGPHVTNQTRYNELSGSLQRTTIEHPEKIVIAFTKKELDCPYSLMADLTKTMMISREQQMQVPFSMFIENVKLMHSCSVEHLSTGTLR